MGTNKGLRVAVFRIKKRRRNCMLNLSPKQKRVIKDNVYIGVRDSFILPYHLFYEEGVAKWLFENFGTGRWAIWKWRFKGEHFKGEWKTAYLPLIVTQVIAVGEDDFTFNTINKSIISRCSAWRDIIYNRMVQGLDYE